MELVRLTCSVPPEVEELGQLLSDHFANLSAHELSGLLSDFEFIEFVSASGTDEVVDVRCCLQFCSRFEDFLATLRACKIEIAHA